MDFKSIIIKYLILCATSLHKKYKMWYNLLGMSIIEFKNVSFSYKEGGSTIKDLSFTIEKGEFAVFIGRNGSGKSTTAKLINCLLTPTHGSVLVDGMDTKDKASKFEIRKSAGMVFQNPDNQFIGATVRDDIAFGLENHSDRKSVV